MGRDHSCEVCGTGGFNSEHDWQKHAVIATALWRILEASGDDLDTDIDEEEPIRAALRKIDHILARSATDKADR